MIKIIFLSLGGLILTIGIITALVMNLHPVFGGSHSKDDKVRYSKSGHYKDGKFFNLIRTEMDLGFTAIIDVLKKQIQGDPERSPKDGVPYGKLDSADIANNIDTMARVTWFGHSAILLELDGKTIFLDPMLGHTSAPFRYMGPGRYVDGLPISIEDLPEIDLVLFSHDHYDHLDYGSVVKLRDKVKKWMVPLGLDAHLKAWGVKENQIIALNWWDESEQEGFKIACTPARHFSGRGILDRNTTMWASWVIEGSREKIYFSGDGGYGPHFKEIGQKYGPFDLAMLECGQYNKYWAAIHMMPEESVQAGIDVNAKSIMPIHWGAFTLALHTWKDPVLRFTAEARRLEVDAVTPVIGVPFTLNEKGESWWEGVN